MKYQLKVRQICLLIIGVLPLTKLFTLPSILATVAKQDMWISAILSITLDLITVCVLLYISAKTKKTYFEILRDTFGGIPAKIIFFIYFLYFVLRSILPIIEQRNFIELTLYPTMPRVLYFFPFFVTLFYFCTKKMRVLGRVGDIIWIFTVLGYLLLMALSIAGVDFTALLPVMTNGVKNIASGTYYSANWFGDGVYLLFFIGQFYHKKKTSIKVILSYLASGLIVILFMVFFYGSFISIASKQQFALTEISKYSEVINEMGRYDNIGIFMLMLSEMFALSLPTFIACKIFDEIFEIKKSWISPLITLILVVIPTVFLEQYTYSIQKFMIEYGGIIFLTLGNFVPILTLIFNYKEKKSQKKEEVSDENKTPLNA